MVLKTLVAVFFVVVPMIVIGMLVWEIDFRLKRFEKFMENLWPL